MPVFQHSNLLPLPTDVVWAFHANLGALQRLLPPWQSITIRSQRGGLADARIVMKMGASFAAPVWTAQHRPDAYVDGEQFQDVQESGPMARWRHTHRVEVAAGGSRLTDHIDYALPLHTLTFPADRWFVRPMLETTFRWRHVRTLHDAGRHAAWAGQPRLRIVLAGSSGLIGSHLAAYLANAGHRVERLVRATTKRGYEENGGGGAALFDRTTAWTPEDPVPTPDLHAALEGVDAVIHLGGANIAESRVTAERRREILASRVESTRLLATAIGELQRPPGVFAAASGTNIYAPADAPHAEDAPLGSSFWADVARRWEEATQSAAKSGRTRVVNLRIGVVLSAKGGFLEAMAAPGPAGVRVSRLGGGEQRVPWVHMDDLLAAVEHILHTPTLAGPVNIAAPVVTSNRELLAAVNRASHGVIKAPAPERLVRAVAGVLAASILESQAVRPAKLLASGFGFAYTDPFEACGMELGHPGVVHQVEDRLLPRL